MLSARDQQFAVLEHPARRQLVHDRTAHRARAGPCRRCGIAAHADAELSAERGVFGQMQRLAVNRNEDLRLHPADQILELGAARMARHMHEMRAIGDDGDVLVDQAVDHAADFLFVSGNGARGEDHRVALAERHVGMIVLRDARQAPRAARPGCRCRAPPPCRAADSHRCPCRGTAARLRDSRFRARPGSRAPWRGRRPRLRGRRRARPPPRRGCGRRWRRRWSPRRAPAPPRSIRARSSRHRSPTASGLRAPHWWNRRRSRARPPRRACATWLRRSADPITGVGSIFQSPVCRTLPCGVRRISALDSGIECATETSSISNAPSVKRDPSGIDIDRHFRRAGLASALWIPARRP